MITEQIEILTTEIRELHRQYVAEVGPGRRVWPKSIKERVEKLDEMGIPAKQISLHTGIGYETILQWRYQRRYRLKRQFHPVRVTGSIKAISKIDTVTVPKVESSKGISKNGTVTVTTPQGYRIEATDAESVIQILKGLP